MMEWIVDLVKYVAWPGTVLIIAYAARDEIKGIVKALSTRIGDPRADLSISKDGLEIKTRIDAAAARIESLAVDQEQVKSLTLEAMNIQPMIPSAASPHEAREIIDPELKRMADEYMSISLPEWNARVRAKDEAARSMANFVITRNISRDRLAAEHNEGIILALASTVHVFPEPGDFDRLSRVADEINRHHVKYRMVLAFGKLFERNLATVADVPRVKSLLSLYKKDADDSLLRRIRQTEALIGQVTGVSLT